MKKLQREVWVLNGITVEQIERAVGLAQAHAIKITVSGILGMLNEPYKDIQKTIDFMISLRGDTFLAFCWCIQEQKFMSEKKS